MREVSSIDNPNDYEISLNKEEVCIFCTTPFQVMGAISIVKSEKLTNVDLYLYNSFNGYEDLANKLKKLNLFRKVVIVDFEKLMIELDLTSEHLLLIKKATIFLMYIKNLVFLNKTVNKYLDCSANYNRIYVSTNHFAGRFAILFYIKNHRQIRVFHYDDGIGSYYGSGELDAILPYDRLCRKVFVGKRAINIPFVKLLFSPSFYRSVCETANACFPQNMTRIVKMDPLEKCESNDSIIRNIFGLTTDWLINQSFIYFDTIKAEEFNNKGIRHIQQISSLIQSCVGKDNIIYKFHPRDKNIDPSLPYIKNTSVPFECFCYFNDFSNKVLITNFSTSVFTPKILYGQEPTIVFLYKIMADYQIMNIDTTIVDALRAIYSDKSKIIIPTNVEELKTTLERLNCR